MLWLMSSEPQSPIGTAGSDPSVVPREVLSRWYQAEERLYPVVMVVPERYRAAVRLVGQVTDELRASCADLSSLVAAESKSVELARRLGSLEPAPAGDLDPVLVAGAACSIRYRELAGG